MLIALWAKQGQDEQVRTLLRNHYGAVTSRLLPVCEALFAAFGRTPRPPFTTEMFAVALTALSQGLALRIAVEPDAVPLGLPAPPRVAPPAVDPSGPGSWDLFSALVETLLHGMTAEVAAAEQEPAGAPARRACE